MQTSAPPPPLSHTIEETMAELNSSRATVYKEIRDGRLLSFKIGRRRFVSHEALVGYIRAREREAQGVAAA